MSSVTLSWDDPEDAAEFKRIRAEYTRQGWLWDYEQDRLLELVRDSKDSTEGERDG